MALFVVGAGYLCLTFCLAEMTSMMPFAGGSFGYVRCTLGPITGYLVGCCETMEYILYVATSVVEFGNLVSQILGASRSYEPLYWIVFYMVSLVIHAQGGRLFWRVNSIVTLLTVLLIVLYCLAALPHVNFGKYAVHESSPGHSDAFNMSFTDVMYFFPLISWFYVGVEAMTLSCDDIRQANRTVPKMMVMSMLTLLVTSISLVFAVAAQPPGTKVVAEESLPLNPGYALAFHLHSHRLLALFALPGIYSTAYGFMFAYGRQLRAMSRSGLLPSFLGQAWGKEATPLPALLTGSILGTAVLLILWVGYPPGIDRLFGLCMLSSCTVYVALFVSFLVARSRLASVPRAFTSPLGHFGAYFGILVFLVMIVAITGFQRDHGASLIAYSLCLLTASLHYFLIARKREYLSLEEQAQLMKAYLLHSKFIIII